MSVRNIVKVMNFHSLLRVNGARERIEEAHEYEKNLGNVFVSIINNRNFQKEQTSIKFSGNKELNIYIGSDLGFCSSFNNDVNHFIKEDNPNNDKIIIGKKLIHNIENVLLFFEKESYLKNDSKVFDIILNGLLYNKYSKVNIIYIHYYNINSQKVTKKQILPFDFESLADKEELDYNEDYSVEGNLNYILWNLVSVYVSAEITVAEALSWAAENIERQKFTSESLKKIDENEEIKIKTEKKEKRMKTFKEIVDLNNSRNAKNRKEE